MTLQEQIRSNNLRTALLFLGFFTLFGAMAFVLGGVYDPSLLGIVGIVGIVWGLVSWFASGRMVAATSGARPVTVREAPELHRAVELAAIGAGLARTPAVYLVDDAAPNAFAAGRSLETAYVAATRGLVEVMDQRELEAVMAHEIAHVRNRDVRLMTVAAILVGVVAVVSDMLLRSMWFGGSRRSREGGSNPVMAILAIVLLVLAPLIAMTMQMALSRRREFVADATAAEITGDAGAMASALAKLGRDTRPLQKVTKATAPMYIENPLRDHHGLRSSLGGMFDTHPPLHERIEALCAMGGLDPAQFVVPQLEAGG